MKRLTKAVSICLALSMVFGLYTSLPSFAQTEDTQQAEATGQRESTVTINSSSSFKVTVPATITVSQPSKAVLNESYNVKVEGDIKGTETVKVVPDYSFSLNQQGKVGVPVTVTQPKQLFRYNEINGTNGCTTQGTLETTNEVTAGTWIGNLTFHINIEDSNRITSLDAGIYQTGTTNMLKSWDDLINEGTLHVNNGVLTSNFDGMRNSSSTDLLGDLVIGDEVTELGSWSLASCNQLTSITIPDNVTAIDNHAFLMCTGLDTVNIGDGVTSIGESAFYYCTDLNKVTLGNNVNTIGNDAFSFCENLTGIDIPESVTSIGSGVFVPCKRLTEISVDSANPNYCSVAGVLFNKDKTIIECYPADRYSSTYIIPDSVNTIGPEAFYSCSKLDSIIINDNVNSIGDYAFFGCAGIKNITIPDRVKNIGKYAFDSCSNLTAVTFKNPSGWYVGNTAGAKTTALNSSNLSNTSTAANYLKTTHYTKYWTCE